MGDERYYERWNSPFGGLGLLVDAAGRLLRLVFLDPDGRALGKPPLTGSFIVDPRRTTHVRQQLGEYFASERRSFDLELAPQGSDFQQRVWRFLLDIPPGETRTYGEVSARLGHPRAARAVGRANATNPIPIIIPCHRLVGANGSLTGFGGGLSLKQALLELERASNPPSARALADEERRHPPTAR